MAENENMIIEEPKEKKVTWAKFKAGFKEWGRKQIVNLKRRPSNIAFLFLIITSLIFILSLMSMSEAVYRKTTVTTWSGICLFGGTLFSILIFVSYMNSFPKRKKSNIPMLCVTGLFIALLFLFDIVFYVEMSSILGAADTQPCFQATLNVLIVHMVFLGITVVLMATMPLYKKALLKINTRKEIESTVSEMKGTIDLEDAD